MLKRIAKSWGGLKSDLDGLAGILFPRAREVLDDRDREEIDRAYVRVTDPILLRVRRDARRDPLRPGTDKAVREEGSGKVSR